MFYKICDEFRLRIINQKLVFVNKFKSNELYVVENPHNVIKISNDYTYIIVDKSEELKMNIIDTLNRLKDENIIGVAYESRIPNK